MNVCHYVQVNLNIVELKKIDRCIINITENLLLMVIVKIVKSN